MIFFLRLCMASLFFIAIGGNALAKSNPNTNLPSTQIIVYQPATPAPIPNKKTTTGSCYSPSLIVQRPGAWRCLVNRMVYDPCFKTQADKQMVCGANPLTKDPGFLVDLNHRLQKGGNRANPNFAWILELTDGSFCSFNPSGTNSVGYQPINFMCTDISDCDPKKGCRHLSGLLGYPKHGRIWTVDKIIYEPSMEDDEIISRSTVAVKTVWQ